MMLPPLPGGGPYPLTLNTPAFYLLFSVLGLFVAMLLYLGTADRARRTGLQGYFEAAGVDLGFLLFAFLLVVGLTFHDPEGNRTSWALDRVVLSGYWLTFAIPLVTVASSVDARSRGRIPWLWPSLGIAGAMFLALFAYYFYSI